MNDLGFSEEEKNWATLMYNTISYGQYLDDAEITPDDDSIENPDWGSGEAMGGDGSTEVVYYNQTEEPWASKLYGKSGTIKAEGCGPTSMAIVISTLTGQKVTPLDAANWSVQHGYRAYGNGSSHTLIPAIGRAYGLSVQGIGRGTQEQIKSALSSGKLIVALMGAGHFTRGGHFIVLRGVSADGKIIVADPASRKRSAQTWDLSLIMRETKSASAGGPLWVIGK